jgi:hypothetical protein
MKTVLQLCHHDQPKARGGFTMIEAVVSAGLLLVVMTFVVQMTVRVDGVWKDTTHHRVALQELSNQLESLTQLSVDDARERLGNIEVSDEVQSTLHDAVLSGDFIDDEFGQRIELQLKWNHGRPSKPVRMSAWMRPLRVANTESQE